MDGRVHKKVVGYFLMAITIISFTITFMLYWKGTIHAYLNLKSKPTTICFEDESNSPPTGLDDVIPIETYDSAGQSRDQKCNEFKERNKTDSELSDSELWRKEQCADNFTVDFKRYLNLFWTGNNQYIRWFHHNYLTSDSVIIDVGGNVGDDANALMNDMSQRKYILLEPMKHMYHLLKKRFENREFVVLYNFGLGAKNEKFRVNIEGTVGEGTSIFKDSGMPGTCSLSVVNTTAFMMKLGVGCIEVDLLTISCEGCEFDVLESLVSSDLVKYFKNIQFATHPNLKHLNNPVGRYCTLQEWLTRTHRLTYQYKFIWESWRRKDQFV